MGRNCAWLGRGRICISISLCCMALAAWFSAAIESCTKSFSTNIEWVKERKEELGNPNKKIKNVIQILYKNSPSFIQSSTEMTMIPLLQRQNLKQSWNEITSLCLNAIRARTQMNETQKFYFYSCSIVVKEQKQKKAKIMVRWDSKIIQ